MYIYLKSSDPRVAWWKRNFIQEWHNSQNYIKLKRRTYNKTDGYRSSCVVSFLKRVRHICGCEYGVCRGKEFWLYTKIRNWRNSGFSTMRLNIRATDVFIFQYFPNYQSKEEDFFFKWLKKKSIVISFLFLFILNHVIFWIIFPKFPHVFQIYTILESQSVMVNFMC